MTQEQQGTGLAVTSLVFGILSLFCGGPLFGVPGLICGIMALSKAKKGEAGGQGLAIAGTVTSGVGSLVGLASLAILAGMLLPVLSKAREKARRANCSGNLKQMGVACLMYSGDYSGYFPTTFDTLDSTGYMMASSVYRCPAASDYSPGPTLPSQGNYMYFGSGLRDDNAQASSVVLVADKDDNHPGGEWINVLFIDGHVEGTRGPLADAAQMNGWIVPGLNDQQSGY